MSDVFTVVGGVVAFIASAALARSLALYLKRFGTRALIAAGVVIVVAATALAWWGVASGSGLVWGVALGAGFGGLSGLRYGNGTLFDVLGRRSDAGDPEHR
ncbi:MAG TPA: hypothetical protein VIK31_08060 [Propionibacteriaceae bacterium]